MFNPYYPNYPNYQNYTQNYQNCTQSLERGIVRVNGIQGAQAYQMGANSSVALFDANEDFFYIKTTDGAGFASVRKFKFVPCDDAQPEAVDYVTRKEFEELKGMIENGKQHIREAE